MGHLTTTAVFIGLCCLLVEHVHSGKTSSKSAKAESAKANTELAKVANFSKAERVFEELEATIKEGGELEEWVKKMKDRFENAKKAVNKKELEEASRHLADFGAYCKAAQALLKDTNAETWMSKTLVQIRDAEYVAQQAVKTAKKEYSAAQNNSEQSEASAEEKKREFFEAKQKLSCVKKVLKAKKNFDEWTNRVEVLKGQELVPQLEKMTEEVSRNQESGQGIKEAEEAAEKARGQLVEKVKRLCV